MVNIKEIDDQTLLKLAGVLGIVFYLDKHGPVGENLFATLRNLLEKIQKLNHDEQELFFSWFEHIFLRKLEQSEKNDVIQLIKEGKVGEEMELALERYIRVKEENVYNEGVRDGEEKGISYRDWETWSYIVTGKHGVIS